MMLNVNIAERNSEQIPLATPVDHRVTIVQIVHYKPIGVGLSGPTKYESSY
jgi:hypothetical protein